MQKYAIILAAGKGQRMNSAMPKQFLMLHRKPLWYYAVNAFLNTFSNVNIIIATLPESIQTMHQEVKKYFPNTLQKIDIIAGGEMRFHSVKNALAHIPTNPQSIVFIHDAARCLIQPTLLKKLYTTAHKYQSAIPIVGVTDSMRQRTHHHYLHLDRQHIFSVQTPQVFHSDILFKAFASDFKPHFTDDASVVENAGYELHFMEGDISNIKVTYPIDIEIAKWYLKNKIF